MLHRISTPVPSLRALALTSLAGLLGITFGHPIGATEIEPYIEAGLVYTDNLRLDSNGNEESEIAAQIVPGINIDHETNRIQFHLDGNLQFIFYQDASEGDATFADGNAALDITLVPEHLFLDSFAGISQTPVNPAKPLSNTNIPLTSNRTDRRLLQTSPHWESLLFNNELNLSYTIGQIDYDDVTLQDTLFQIVDSSYSSQPGNSGLGWSLNHNYASYDYDLGSRGQYQTLTGNVDYAFSDDFALTSLYGVESDFLKYSSADLTEEMWSLGISLATEKIELVANAGERSYGSTAFLKFRLNLTDKGFFQMDYSENPATTESLARQREIPDDPNIPETPPVIDTPGTSNAFINKRYQATLAQSFSKNSFTLSGYLEEQTDFVTQDGSPPPEDREQYGVTLDWAYDLSSKTQLAAFGRWANQQLTSDGARSDLYILQLEIDYKLGRRTAINFWISRTQRTGSEINTEDYTENQAGFLASRAF